MKRQDVRIRHVFLCWRGAESCASRAEEAFFASLYTRAQARSGLWPGQACKGGEERGQWPVSRLAVGLSRWEDGVTETDLKARNERFSETIDCTPTTYFSFKYVAKPSTPSTLTTITILEQIGSVSTLSS